MRPLLPAIGSSVLVAAAIVWTPLPSHEDADPVAPPGRSSLNEYTRNTIAASLVQVTVFQHLSDSADTGKPFATKNRHESRRQRRRVRAATATPIRVRIRADAEVVGGLNIDNRNNAAKCGRRCA